MSNIVLIGFMGCGKSKIGHLLASELQMELVDLDDLIETKEAKTIAEIFRDHGDAHFRALELAVLTSLKDKKNAVIVTGGGTPTNFFAARLIHNLGKVFYLDAAWPLLLARISKNKTRPLSHLPAPELKALFDWRKPIYEHLGVSIDVNHEQKNLIVNEIAERFNSIRALEHVRKITIGHGNKSYPIMIGEHSINLLKHLLVAQGLGEHARVLVTNEELSQTLAPVIERINQQFEKPVPLITFESGERHKTYESVSHIHHAMLSLGLTRQTVVLALGGGVVGDVAGFAGAIYLRGVPVIQIPTSLLAMVDSSVGGKTGIDIDEGKNLVGAFHNPTGVMIDPSFLSTLPPEEFACGMAEIIKHAIIGDEVLFHALLTHQLESAEMVERALLVKAKIVAEDPLESGVRAHLNLGHTFGHAIELVSGYQIKHGQAVAMGLMLAVKFAKAEGILVQDFSGDLEKLLTHFKLPTAIPVNLAKEALVDAMRHDKKRDNRGLKLILPRKLGEVITTNVDERALRDFF